MTIFRKLVKIAGVMLLTVLAAVLIIPLLLPQSSSGTLSHRQAADPDAEFLTIDGLDVHLRFSPHTGNLANPPLIVLLHGFGASVYSWREVMAPLTAYANVLAYDRPAFGWTSRDTTQLPYDVYSEEGNRRILAQLIRQHAPANTKVILAGHSAGGGVAVNYALAEPYTVDALILVAPAVRMSGNRSAWSQRLARLPQVRRTAIWLFGRFAERGLGLLEISWHDPERLTADIVEGYTRPTRIVGWERALWEFSMTARSPLDDGSLSTLSLPTLIITGDDDRVIPAADSIALAGLMPASSLEIIPASGHLPHEETPEAFLAAIETHWDWLTNSVLR